MGLTEIQVKALRGISEAQAAHSLATQGPNELPSAKKRGVFSIAFEVVKEPMFLLLLACGGIYLVLGDIQEAIMLWVRRGDHGITIYPGAEDGEYPRGAPRPLQPARPGAEGRGAAAHCGPRGRAGDVIILSEGTGCPPMRSFSGV